MSRFWPFLDDGRFRVRGLTTRGSPTVGPSPLQWSAAMDSIEVNHTVNDTLPSANYDYSERPETYIVPALFAFIFIVGVVGNGSLVMIFVRHKHMINVPNIYILSLALGDLLVLLSSIPFTSIVYTV